MSIMVKLEKGAGMDIYDTYGKMISFDQLAENTKQELMDFISQCVSRNAVWLLVILFGVAGTSYLMAQKNRYTWGVYSLLGMSS